MKILSRQINWLFCGICAAVIPQAVIVAILASSLDWQLWRSFNKQYQSVAPLLTPLTSSSTKYGLNLPEIQHLVGGSVTSDTAKRGETIEKFLKRNKFSGESANQAAGIFRAVSDTDLKKGELVKICRSSSNDVLSIKRDLPGGDYVMVNGDPTHGYFASFKRGAVGETERVVSGTIKGAFSKSAQKAGMPYEIIDQLADLFGDRIDFRRDLKVGDTFSVVFAEKRGAKGKTKSYGDISAASITANGKAFNAVRYTGTDGRARYFDENAKSYGDSFLRYPLKFTKISSVFSGSRFHPILKTRRAHRGVDFAAPPGTPVRTIGDGVVTYAGRNGGSGNMIRIRHNSTYETAYLHLQKFDPKIKKGVRVSMGQIIGAVGCTGLCSGPHLHFELYQNGLYVDPLKTTLPQIIQRENQIPQTILAARIDALNAQHEQVQLAALGERRLRG